MFLLKGKFGLFAELNYSNSWLFTMFTGIKNFSQIYLMEKWNWLSKLNFGTWIRATWLTGLQGRCGTCLWLTNITGILQPWGLLVHKGHLQGSRDVQRHHYLLLHTPYLLMGLSTHLTRTSACAWSVESRMSAFAGSVHPYFSPILTSTIPMLSWQRQWSASTPMRKKTKTNPNIPCPWTSTLS